MGGEPLGFCQTFGLNNFASKQVSPDPLGGNHLVAVDMYSFHHAWGQRQSPQCGRDHRTTSG